MKHLKFFESTTIKDGFTTKLKDHDIYIYNYNIGDKSCLFMQKLKTAIRFMPYI